MTLNSDSLAQDDRVAELEVALERETRVSAALREVGLALGTTLELDELLELILNRATDAVEGDRATLYLLDETRDELMSRIVQGTDVKAIRLKVGHGIAGHVARTGKPLIVKDAYTDPRFNPDWDILSGYRTRSILAVPMKNHLGRAIGVIQVLNKQTSGEFSEVDAEVLAVLATQAAIAIDNSRLFLSVTQKNIQLLDIKEQLEHRVRDLKLLFQLESAMGRSSSLDEMLVGVLTEAMRAVEARGAAVLMRNQTSGEHVLYVVDEKHKALRRLLVREGQGLIGYCLRNNEPLFITGAEEDLRNDASLDALVGFHADSCVALPLEGEAGELVGAIALYNKIPVRGFTEEDRELIALIAANASTAIRLQVAREERAREDRLTTIGRLLSGLIHDLKTPLGVISGYVQMMQEASKKKDRDEFAGLILRQFHHITAMQREVLEFARGEQTILLRRVYLQKFFDDVEAQLERQFASRKIRLKIDLGDRGTARFDEGKILRAIHNLATNAAEAMGDGGGAFTISVQRTVEDGAIVMTFTDTGPGIPKEIEHRVFESFVTSGKKRGTGLGLAIVKKIAEEHGGAIVIRPTAAGACFALTLPQPAPRSSRFPPPLEEPAKKPRPRVRTKVRRA